MNLSSILSEGFSAQNEAKMLLHLARLDTTNSVLCVQLESIDLMLLKLTRLAIESSEDYLGIADWIVI